MEGALCEFDDLLNPYAGTPYGQGLEAAARRDPLKCPYPDGTPEADEWWEAVGDWLDGREANENT
jgi:hypothetical protein